MSTENPRGIVELGNIYVKCIIFKINQNNISEILSTSITESEGIHNGVIVNLEKASKVIRSSISAAEEKAKVTIKKTTVLIEQPEFLCTKLSKQRKIDGSKIHKYDIDFLLKESKKQIIHNDNNQSIIHIFNHNYIVDGKTFVEEPIDVFANSLSHEMTFITVPKNNLRNINHAFNNCDIEVERYISSIFASAVYLLNDREMQSGSILIDMGFEKTSLGIFKYLALVHSITLPAGIHHIAKDISKICSLDIEESKTISKKIDFIFQNKQELFDFDNYLKNIYFTNSGYRKISKSLILDIIKSRIDEIFQITKKQIIETGFSSLLYSNIYITGGGSNLLNIDKYCSTYFGSKVKKLDLNRNGIKNEKDLNFVSCLGALEIIKDGWETEAIPDQTNKNDQKLSFFAKIFGKEM